MNKILPSLSFYLFLTIAFLFAGQAVKAQSLNLASLQPLNEIEGRGLTHPTFSPDGNTLALSSSTRNGIYLYSFSSSSLTPLSSADGIGSTFSWTPDSRFIIARETKRTDLYNEHAAVLIPISGEQPTYLTEFVSSMPTYPKVLTHQGEMLVSLRRNVKTLQTNVLNKVSSTKPRFVASAINSTLRIYRDGTVIENIRSSSDILNESISENGQWVVFERLGKTTLLRSLVTNQDIDLGFLHRPVLSPNGRYVAGMITEDDGYSYQSSDIVLIDTETLEEINLTSSEGLMGMNPHWSPDGLQLVFEDFASGSIYLATFTLN